MKFTRRIALFGAAAAAALSIGSQAARAEAVSLHAATYFADDHAYNKTLQKFFELLKAYSNGEVEGIIHPNGELGDENDYLAFMSQGISVDVAVVAPGNIATFSPIAPILDLPFLFRDKAHWEATMNSDVFAPIEQGLKDAADVIVIGYAGGGTRNIIANRPIASMDDLAGFKMRVQGAPIHAQIFGAFGIVPSVVAYNEVYNAIQTGVVDGLENEAASLEQRKFYEVAKYIALSQHTITVRPIVFSGKTFAKLSPELQQAVLKAGKEAGAYGRDLESSQDGQKLDALAAAGLIEVHEIAGREKMLELAAPIRAEFAAKIGGSEILNAVDGM